MGIKQTYTDVKLGLLTMNKERFQILWACIKHVFTGKGVILQNRTHVRIESTGMYCETWVRHNEQIPWNHYAMSFDWKVAKGYKDGALISGPDTPDPTLKEDYSGETSIANVKVVV